MQWYIRHTCLKILFPGVVTLITLSAHSQNKSNTSDTAFFLANKKGLLGKIGRSISVNNPISSDSIPITINNIDPFILYRGATIRNIKIINVGFGGSVNDTAIKKQNNFLNNLGNAIHRSTKEKFIRNNLFFKQGDQLSAYLVADNERFLRDQPYLQDARIIVNEVGEEQDSVDVTVFYKDVFSISGNVDAGSEKSLFFEVQDDNFMGSGQRLKVQNLYDLDRKNKYAFGMEYLKRNIAGTFVNFTAGYQGSAPAFNSGRREETNVYTKIELPLVSPYYLWTGSIEASLHYTTNNYLGDSLFYSNYNYRYAAYDMWAGYNISAKKLLDETTQRKLKEFVALRLVKNDFLEVPAIYERQYNFQYANLTSVLGAFTTFKQDYYRTSFIYGFGRNEDIPVGFNVSAIGGWTNKQNYTRPYAGLDLQKNYISKGKAYYNYELKFGGYFNQGSFQDMSLLLSLESFTKLRRLGNSRWLLRHFIGGSITQLANTFLNEPLRINSDFGIPAFNYINGFNGSTRISANCESVFYNTWKFLGFSFAPFVFGNFTYLRSAGIPFLNGDMYSALGGGVRTRNENLVFGTMELRLQYFPRTTAGMSPWNIGIQTDLKFKYNSQFIKRPDFVSAN